MRYSTDDLSCRQGDSIFSSAGPHPDLQTGRALVDAVVNWRLVKAFIQGLVGQRCLPGIVLLLASTVCPAAPEEGDLKMAAANFNETYVMLYYSDLEAPRRFYGDILGMEAVYGDDWNTLYRILPGAHVGIIREGKGAWHPVQKENSVMLSLVVDDVDDWYKKIRDGGEVIILKHIYRHESAPIRAFLVQDPGGYTVELFQWIKDQE